MAAGHSRLNIGGYTLAYRLYSHLRRLLCASAISLTALSGTASASDDIWGPLQLVDMTSEAPEFGGDMLVTTGFVDDLSFVAFQEPDFGPALGALSYQSEEAEPQSGWSGVLDVDREKDPSTHIRDLSSFSDTFAQGERETRLSGFYTMRYQFETDLPFRPYAGAGLGVVGSETSQDMAGVVAGRAMAGFDFAVDARSAIYAEYAFVKSGGVTLGTAGNGRTALAVPDTDHSLRLGFRRTF